MARKKAFPKKAPTLSIVIPTQGRETLKRTLDSCIAGGLGEHDEIIIATDIHGLDDAARHELHERIERTLPFFEGGWSLDPVDAGHHDWGHCQINSAIRWSRGDYIVLNDDDDVFTPGAFDRIRATIAALDEPVPLLYRFRSWWGNVYWDEPGIARENHIGGHCAVFPNDDRLGRFTCRYQGDYDYIRSTLDNWGGDHMAVWVDDVIAVARPTEEVAA